MCGGGSLDVRQALLFALMSTLLSGCFVGGNDCYGQGSATAPTAAFLHGSEREVVARVAAAFGDPLDGRRDGETYRSERGGWRASGNDGRIDLVNFFGTGDPWLDEGLVRESIARLGFDASALNLQDGVTVEGGTNFRLWQSFQGAWIASVDLSSLPDTVTPGSSDRHFTSLDVGSLRDLSNAMVAIDEETAVAAAQEAMACTGTSGTLDTEHVGVGVFGDSVVRTVAYSVPAPGEHCDPTGATVQVDAVTGEPLAIVPWGCA